MDWYWVSRVNQRWGLITLWIDRDVTMHIFGNVFPSRKLKLMDLITRTQQTSIVTETFSLFTQITRPWTNVVLMLHRRLRRWYSIKPTLGWRHVFTTATGRWPHVHGNSPRPRSSTDFLHISASYGKSFNKIHRMTLMFYDNNHPVGHCVSINR